MFDQIADAFVTKFSTLQGVGQYLQGVTTVRKGPVDPSTIGTDLMPILLVTLLPCMTFRAGGTGARKDVGAEVSIELYVSALGDPADAASAAWQLILSSDQTKGLDRALDTRGYMTVGGVPFRINTKDLVYVPLMPDKNGSSFTFGIQCKVGVTTMINAPPP